MKLQFIGLIVLSIGVIIILIGTLFYKKFFDDSDNDLLEEDSNEDDEQLSDDDEDYDNQNIDVNNKRLTKSEQEIFGVAASYEVDPDITIDNVGYSKAEKMLADNETPDVEYGDKSTSYSVPIDEATKNILESKTADLDFENEMVIPSHNELNNEQVLEELEKLYPESTDPYRLDEEEPIYNSNEALNDTSKSSDEFVSSIIADNDTTYGSMDEEPELNSEKEDNQPVNEQSDMDVLNDIGYMDTPVIEKINKDDFLNV